LKHSADPRLRSFIVNWLSPLGADPRAVAAGLDGFDPKATPGGAEGRSQMDAVLFHPETSTRRALILALGAYGEEGLSPAEREPLVTKLLDVYRDDPDAGIHGAAEWTLRRWGRSDQLAAAEAGLSKLKEWGQRRWFVNGQGMTFAAVDGPVTFRMGSPESETERSSNERLHAVTIPRRFAVATKEVTVEQWLRFVKTHGQWDAPPGVIERYSPDPGGAMIGFSWYIAADFCNWLSELEMLPKDQWCYLPNEDGNYAARMTVPGDVLLRKGYRLPTEAEWEYSCRSGAVTARPYGHSIELLGSYVRYQANSREHVWSAGGLLPNDLGLFDTLGNAYEWCHDRDGADSVGRDVTIDNIKKSELVDELPRLIRGVSFGGVSAYVRSAERSGIAPSVRSTNYGFRPARTLP
jgi:formylglycine-generating enzyme required for sulfatase activity